MRPTVSPSLQKRFLLPPEGIFKANGKDDPLPYYYKPVVGELYRERIEAGLALLKPPYERILEIGFGSGIVLPSLCALGRDVYGIDIHSAVETVQNSLDLVDCQCTLLQGDVTTADFEKGSFDLIVAFSILEHISELEPLVARLADYLRPGGHFLVGMPRVDRLMEKAFRLIGYNDIEQHHVSDYLQCLRACKPHYHLHLMSRLPSILPESFALYYNMLFERKEVISC